MRDLSIYLKNRKIDNKQLINNNFIKENDTYMLEKEIHNNEFKVVIEITKEKQTSKVIDLISNEEYILVDTKTSGSFVGQIKNEYESIIKNFIEKCTTRNVFKEENSKEVIKYVKEKYGTELEFLWEQYPNYGVLRNKDNNKWYGMLGVIKESSLGKKSENYIEGLNLKYQTDKINKIIDNKTIYPGYHMNKKSWITIVLNSNIDKEKLKRLIDNSYNLLNAKASKSIDDLSEKVYDYLTKIPKGKVVTYKQIAEHLGNKGLSRIVGTILHNNKDGDKYPCYKVLNSKGELAEAFVFGGKEIQKQRLEKDGIEVKNYKVDLNKYKW